MRGATNGSLQLQQILRLPRKMNLMIDPHRIWNVIYNARNNRHHPPTSANTAPATQNESHDWSLSHMTRHLQCAEQQSTPSNLTEQRLRLPRKMNLMIDPHHRWNVIYNARSNSQHQHPPTLPNTAPATQNESHDWSASHMTRHLQCAEQQASPSNRTKCCACHAKWISWLIRITYDTSFTMRGAEGITLQPYLILRLPRKMNLMIDPHHRWNVIYNARNNRHRLPTLPKTAPAMQNERPTSDRNLLKTGATSFPMRHPSIPFPEYPSMIRDRSDPDNANWTRRAAKATFRTRQE